MRVLDGLKNTHSQRRFDGINALLGGVGWLGSSRILVTSFMALIIAAGTAFGSLISPRSLSDLQQTSDLIVAGTASGGFGPSSGVFSLQVNRVIKGDASGVIPVIWSNKASGTANTRNETTAAGSGLWFIQLSSAGWVLIPVVDGDVPFNMTFFPAPASAVLSAYSYTASTSLGDKIASEVCSASESLAGAYNFQLYALQPAILDQLGSQVVAVYYQRMASSSLMQQQILGLSGLIRGGNATALSASMQAAAAFGTYTRENGILQQSIRDQFRTGDSGAIAVLGKAAVNSALPGALREAAAHALAAIHTLAALPYLAMLFGDSDTNLRIEAIGGMASFANALPTQTAAGSPSLAHLQLGTAAPYRTSATMANFALGYQAIERNEASYLAFWEQWWSQNRAALGF